MAAPSEARQALRPWLDHIDFSMHAVGDILLIVSELVTNVVTHTQSDCIVTAEFNAHRLRIEVHDHDPNPPVVIGGAPIGGFGLPLVQALCDAWGWAPSVDGKHVWIEKLS